MARFRVQRGKVHGVAEVSLGDPTVRRGVCETCGGRVVRSYHTGILHARCYLCRYLSMIYGPNIRVRREDE